LSKFNENSDFLDRFFKNTQISSFMKICPVGADLFHAFKRKNYEEAKSRFSQSWERNKKTLRFSENEYLRVQVERDDGLHTLIV